MFKKNLTNILLILSAGILIFAAGYKTGEAKNRLTTLNKLNQRIFSASDQGLSANSKNLNFSLFWDTWNELDQKFIDKNKLEPKKMFYGAIKGMVASLEDPYTFFLTPEENKEARNDLAGKFEGIGAQLGLNENRIVVVAPLKNSPALKAGVKSGDFINEVDGKSTRGWTLPQAVAKIRGPKGSKVTLLLERESKELKVDIIRDQIRIDSVELSYEKSSKGGSTSGGKNLDIAILKLNQFGDNTNDEWDRAVADIANKWNKQEIKGMILDLRDNPGGYLESSVYLASEFIPAGKMIVKQTSTVQNEKKYYSERNGKLLDIPMIVLINKGSASAAEILSGAIRDYKRAKLVGEKSFGKGSVQEAANLKDGAGLHVTVAKWILPNGDWINGKGIQPDIKVENKTTNGNSQTRETDKQLDKAIEELIK